MTQKVDHSVSLDLIYSYAKEQGLSSTSVDLFLVRQRTATTLRELVDSPDVLKSHLDDSIHLPRVLKEYITTHVLPFNGDTVTLQNILTRMQADLETSFGVLTNDVVYKELKMEDAHIPSWSSKERVEKLLTDTQAVETILIEVAFGSAVYVKY